MAKYFINAETRSQLGSTCYYEFYKGKWDEQKMEYWRKDSLYIHDDHMYLLKLDALICSVVEAYAPFGETEIDPAQWQRIRDGAEAAGGELLNAVNEAVSWVEDTFRTHGVVTILGI